MTDDEIMTHYGWDIVCEGNFASGFPAQLTIDHFKNEYEMEQREKKIEELEEVKRRYVIKEIDLNEFLKQTQDLSDKLLEDNKG